MSQIADVRPAGGSLTQDRPLVRQLATVLPIVLVPFAAVAAGAMNFGQGLTWIAFLASLVSTITWLAAAAGREEAAAAARATFRLQWLALAASSLLLWRLIFTHDFRYEYVASYSSTAMPDHYLFAAFWGGQEGTFVLWALFTATLGLVFMRVRHALVTPAMFFLNLPLVMLGLVTVMRGPFLTLARPPIDGNGLNPLLQDPWMTIHPPILFVGFSSLVVPFAIATAAMVRRDYDGWIKPGLPWVVFSTAILATGFIMGGVWAYKVLGWGGYWGWDPVENGSLIPWLSNVALLHGMLVQRVTGSLRRTNFFLAVTSYVLVLYASFLTRSGVLADFSVHSFVNLGLNGFLLSFLFLAAIVGYGLLVFRLRDIPKTGQALGNFSRESMMWLGQLVLMLMCALIAIGMSAPLITRLFGPASNVQTSYYNMVNAPLAVVLGLLLGIGPMMRWRGHDPAVLVRAALPALAGGLAITLVSVFLGVRDPMHAAVLFAMAWALSANAMLTWRGFRAGWKHGVAYLGHAGFAVMMIGVVASSGYGREIQIQLPRDAERTVLDYRLTFEGMRKDAEGKDHAVVAVQAPRRSFEALPAMYWSEFNKGYMKKPHIERFATYDLYLSPLELVGGDEGNERGVWFDKGETKEIGGSRYTFVDFEVEGMGTPEAHIAARLQVETGGRTVPARPVVEIGGGNPNPVPAYLPGGGTVSIVNVDAQTGRVALELPGTGEPQETAEILALSLSTKPLIGLVWLGSIIMLASAFMSVIRRGLDMKQSAPAA